MTSFIGSDPLNNLTNTYQRPVTISANRAPTSNDIYPQGTTWFDNSVSPPVGYTTNGSASSQWNKGDVAAATTTSAGIVTLDTYAALAAGTANGTVPLGSDVYTYVNSVTTAGAPVATTTTQGIVTLATDAKAVAGTASTGTVALCVQPSNLAAVFAAPPATGGTTPAALLLPQELLAELGQLEGQRLALAPMQRRIRLILVPGPQQERSTLAIQPKQILSLLVLRLERQL